MRGLSIAAALAFNAITLPCFAAEPVVALWYRGTPAGTPQLDDLAAIKAAGFDAITWPAGEAGSVEAISRLAERHGLTVVIQPDRPRGLTVPRRLDIENGRESVRERV
jgi:hypothetical protein